MNAGGKERHDKPSNKGLTRKPPGRYQRLDLFIKVLRVLCPNLTDASIKIPKDEFLKARR